MRFLEEFRRQHGLKAAIGYPIAGSIFLLQAEIAQAFSAARASAEDRGGGWQEARSLPDQPNGVTKWDMKLQPGFSKWFGDQPEYREIVGALQ